MYFLCCVEGHLKDNRRYQEAATILDQYANVCNLQSSPLAICYKGNPVYVISVNIKLELRLSYYFVL